MCKIFCVQDFAKYRRAAIDGIKEVERLAKQRRELDDQISKVSRLIAANISMLPEEEQAEYTAALTDTVPTTGLSDAILRVLRGKFLSPIGVREALIEGGYDLSSHVNPLASIHTTLKRLFAARRIDVKQFPDGKLFYGRWEGDRPTIPDRPKKEKK